MLSYSRQKSYGRYIGTSWKADIFEEVTDDPISTDDIDTVALSLLSLGSNNTEEEETTGNISNTYSGVYDGPELGSDVTGILRLITNRKTGENFALRTITMTDVDSNQSRLQLIKDVDILCTSTHHNIVCFEEIYETNDTLYLVYELCTGGELNKMVMEQPVRHYSERKSAQIVKQIVLGIAHLHGQGIIHGNLKLEDFMFNSINQISSSSSTTTKLKLVDFGLSKYFKNSTATAKTRSLSYTASPEALWGEQDERCDCWSIGVITYILLCGQSPFGGYTPSDLTVKRQKNHFHYHKHHEPMSWREVQRNILSSNFEFKPSRTWERISDEAKDFIMSLLCKNPESRPYANEILNLSWLQRYDDENCFTPLLPIMSQMDESCDESCFTPYDFIDKQSISQISHSMITFFEQFKKPNIL